MSTESVPEPVRSISEDLGRHPNTQMHGIGIGVFAVMGVVVLPFLPLLAGGWLVLRAGRAVRRTISGVDPAGPGDGLRQVRADRRRVVEERANGGDTPEDGSL
jgi:hypothetical protein